MNILVDELPKKIKVNKKIYDIRWDYKTCLRIIMAFEDENLLMSEKIYITLKNIFIEDIPEENIEEAYSKAIKFLDGGLYQKESKKESKRIYSFSKDGNYIYTGINATHSIDLEKENVHWWKFLRLFMDMKSECTFGDIVYYRTRKRDGKLTKEEKIQYKKMKDLLELEENKPINEEKESFLKEIGLR